MMNGKPAARRCGHVSRRFRAFPVDRVYSARRRTARALILFVLAGVACLLATGCRSGKETFPVLRTSADQPSGAAGGTTATAVRTDASGLPVQPLTLHLAIPVHPQDLEVLRLLFLARTAGFPAGKRGDIQAADLKTYDAPLRLISMDLPASPEDATRQIALWEQSAQLPDLMWVAEPQAAPTIANRYDLSAAMSENASILPSAVYSSTLDAWRDGTKLTGVPYRVAVPAVIANKDLLERFSLALPEGSDAAAWQRFCTDAYTALQSSGLILRPPETTTVTTTTTTVTTPATAADAAAIDSTAATSTADAAADGSETVTPSETTAMATIVPTTTTTVATLAPRQTVFLFADAVDWLPLLAGAPLNSDGGYDYTQPAWRQAADLLRRLAGSSADAAHLSAEDRKLAFPDGVDRSDGNRFLIQLRDSDQVPGTAQTTAPGRTVIQWSAAPLDGPSGELIVRGLAVAARSPQADLAARLAVFLAFDGEAARVQARRAPTVNALPPLRDADIRQAFAATSDPLIVDRLSERLEGHPLTEPAAARRRTEQLQKGREALHDFLNADAERTDLMWSEFIRVASNGG